MIITMSFSATMLDREVTRLSDKNFSNITPISYKASNLKEERQY